MSCCLTRCGRPKKPSRGLFAITSILDGNGRDAPHWYLFLISAWKTFGADNLTRISAISMSWPPSTRPHSSIWKSSSSLQASTASWTVCRTKTKCQPRLTFMPDRSAGACSIWGLSFAHSCTFSWRSYQPILEKGHANHNGLGVWGHAVNSCKLPIIQALQGQRTDKYYN